MGQNKTQQNKKNKEIRLANVADFNIEQRETEGETTLVIDGYAAVYDSEAFIGWEDWGFYESIARGAFDGADMKDVPLRYNHSDTVPILARTRNKSLTLTPDDKGLFIHAELLDTSDGRDMYKRIKAGLIDKMSFAFTVDKEEVTDKDKKNPRRRITKFSRIFDVSVVDTPAYEDTEINVRSRAQLDDWRDTLDRGEHERKKDYKLNALIAQYKEGE